MEQSSLLLYYIVNRMRDELIESLVANSKNVQIQTQMLRLIINDWKANWWMANSKFNCIEQSSIDPHNELNGKFCDELNFHTSNGCVDGSNDEFTEKSNDEFTKYFQKEFNKVFFIEFSMQRWIKIWFKNRVTMLVAKSQSNL